MKEPKLILLRETTHSIEERIKITLIFREVSASIEKTMAICVETYNS